jgi:mRNA-degrading endonuclease RelE of RelBE toxin-antitoxin system
MAYGGGRKEGALSASSLRRWLPVLIELPPFTRKWEEYELTESDRTALLQAILNDPESSPVVRGTAGARKARFSSHELDRGKSGGYRVFYAVFRKYGKIVLVTLFPKSAQANLSRAAQNLVAQLLREIESELDQIDQEESAKAFKRRR